MQIMFFLMKVSRAGAHSGRVCYHSIVKLNAQSLQLWLPVEFAHHRALGSSVHCTGEPLQ